MAEAQLVGYYCYHCKKSVECEVVLSNLRVVTCQSPHEVKVEVDARSPTCGSFLGSGVAFICLS
jgi:hypothetical protein